MINGSLKWYYIRELRSLLQKIWNDLPEKPEARAVQNFHKHPQTCMNKAEGHLEYII